MIDKNWMKNFNKFGSNCARCNRNFGRINFENYYFCFPCFIKGIVEIKLKREEDKGLIFKFKKDRQIYIKQLEQKEKEIQDKLFFEKNSKPCYFCNQKFLPWKQMLHLAKEIYVGKECVNTINISEDFIKKLEKLREKEKENWFKNNDTFWDDGFDYVPIELLRELENYMIPNKKKH